MHAFDILGTTFDRTNFTHDEEQTRILGHKRSLRSGTSSELVRLLTSAGGQSEVGHQLVNRSKYCTFT